MLLLLQLSLNSVYCVVAGFTDGKALALCWVEVCTTQHTRVIVGAKASASFL